MPSVPTKMRSTGLPKPSRGLLVIVFIREDIFFTENFRFRPTLVAFRCC